MANEYTIQPGDTFYELSKKWGGTWEEWTDANPGVSPGLLRVGQKVNLPQGVNSGSNHYAQIGLKQGQEFSGNNMDEIQLEIEGLQITVRRVGEMRVPHELHFLLPRVEVRKVEPVVGGPCEVQIMMSNLNIIHSPRLMSGEGNPKANIGEIKGAQTAGQGDEENR